MGDLLSTVIVVIVGIGSLLAALGGLYWLTKLLPAKWAEQIGRAHV